jgi:hypothetical protein
MIVIDIVMGAFVAYISALIVMWVYAVLWMLCSIVRGE